MTELAVDKVLEAADDSETDAFVASIPDASPYFLSGWRRAVALTYGHQAGCLINRNVLSNQIEAILPFSVFKKPFSKARIISQPFADFSAVLTKTSATANDFLPHLLQNFQDKSIELRYTYPITQLDMPLGSKVRMVTTLLPDADALLASYKPKLRSQIKKAGKNGLVAAISRQQDALDAFYRVYAKNMHRLGSPVHHPDWFSHLLSCYPIGQMQVVLVSLAEQVVGGAIILINNQQAVIPWASTLSEYNHLAPNMLLYWTIQQYLTERGVTSFDMGRSTPGEGTYRFKEQWGAHPVALDWQLYMPESTEGVPLLRTAKPAGQARKLVEQVWRRLPLSFANRLGGQLRGYISL